MPPALHCALLQPQQPGLLLAGQPYVVLVRFTVRQGHGHRDTHVDANIRLTWLLSAMREACADFAAELKQFNREQDHLHYPPGVELSKLANSLRNISSRRLRQEYKSHARRYLKTPQERSGRNRGRSFS
ncbi:transposase [Streptomyces sp. NBC_01724]|uniref:transposase n=1 Tax=Streptomyces sp. NBC_01724 TaxID=2975922 RepID=UPI002E319869|nr:transposase [Streptomyces sp. NBC_01724]